MHTHMGVHLSLKFVHDFLSTTYLRNNTFTKCLLNYCCAIISSTLRLYSHSRKVSRWQIPAFANQTKILTNRSNKIQKDRYRERERERVMGERG